MHAWGKSDGSGRLSLNRILSVATLLVAITALILALKKPQPVGTPQAPAAVVASAQSFQAKASQLWEAQAQGQTGSAVHVTSDEISAAIAQATSAAALLQGTAANNGTLPADPTAVLAPGSAETANIQEPIISFEGDQIRGQFLTEVAGKKVYVTIAGHLGAKDGYATFDPTEFKLGDLNLPVSLVNVALQKKLWEQRDRLKLPDFVSEVRVENGELVVKQK